jgi:hypothetical protein
VFSGLKSIITWVALKLGRDHYFRFLIEKIIHSPESVLIKLLLVIMSIWNIIFQDKLIIAYTHTINYNTNVIYTL